MAPAWLRAVDDGVEIEVKVTPKSSVEAVGPVRDGRLVVKVNAPPDQGKANKAVCKLIAKTIGVAKSNVSVVSGDTSRSKRLSVIGVDEERALTALDGEH